VNGDVVAWGDDRNSKGDIFVHKLRPETLFGVDIYIIYVLIAAMVITLCALGLVIVSQRKVRPPPRTVKEEMEREEEEVGLDSGMERTARSDGDGGSKVKGEDAARGPKSARPPLMRGPYKR